MRTTLLLSLITLSFLLWGCSSINCKQSCIEENLDNDCCPKIDSTDIQIPESSINEINIFLETSGSMQGYMPKSSPATEFQVIIPDILARLNGQFPGKINFYSIYKCNQAFSKLSLDIAREKILKGSYTWSGSTYIPSMIDSIMNGYLGHDVANIFISDCIYSPEDSNSKITALTTTDIRTMVYPFTNYSTSFFSLYSDYRFSSQSTTQASPYYLILTAKPQNMHLIEKEIITSIQTTDQKYREINFGLNYKKPYFSVLPYTETSENFIANECPAFQNAYLSIQEINLNDDGEQIRFWIGIDLKSFPKYSQEISYLNNNLTLNIENGDVEILDIKVLPYSNIVSDDKDIANRCTHLIQVRVSNLTDCISLINISFKCSIPDWKSTQNESSDENNREKTYRLNDLISGFEQAYCSENNEYFFKDLGISLIKE